MLQEFTNYLQQIGYGIGTQRTLPVLVQEFLEQQCITDTSYIEQQQVKSFYEYLQTRPLKKRNGALSEAMISHYVYALRTFFSWLEVTGQVDYNPVSGIKFKRAKAGTREPLTTEEVKQLFEAAATGEQKALLHIFYSCGLRRSEGEALNTRDIDFKKGLLYVREGKGAKRRVVPLTAPVNEVLECYASEQITRRIKDDAAFFINKVGNRMSGDSCNKVLLQIKEQAGITREVTLHHLRHSIATHLLQSGMHMEYVRDFLGHSVLETTQIYAKPDIKQLKLL